MRHQNMRRAEQVIEWVVEQVDEGRSVQIAKSHRLRGEHRLARARAEHRAKHAVLHVLLMNGRAKVLFDVANVDNVL